MLGHCSLCVGAGCNWVPHLLMVVVRLVVLVVSVVVSGFVGFPDRAVIDGPL